LDPTVYRTGDGNLGGGLDQSHDVSVLFRSIECIQQVAGRDRSIEDQTSSGSRPAAHQVEHPDVLEDDDDGDAAIADLGADDGEVIEVEQPRRRSIPDAEIDLGPRGQRRHGDSAHAGSVLLDELDVEHADHVAVDEIEQPFESCIGGSAVGELHDDDNDGCQYIGSGGV
jgi:hypothetical protein